MDDIVDRELAQFAAVTSAQLNQSFSNSPDGYKMNRNRLDIRRFIPNNQGRHNNQNRPMHHPVPPQYPNYNEPMNVPAQQDMGGAFSPIPLPNKPAGLIPMDEKSMELVSAPSRPVEPRSTYDGTFVPPTHPSFKDTTFKSPTPVTKVIATSDGSVEDILLAQTKMIADLTKKLKTLTTKINSMSKVLDNINAPTIQSTDD